jgi:hypothetical protein
VQVLVGVASHHRHRAGRMYHQGSLIVTERGEIEMKPFVLEEALAGAKVINGQGNPATDIAYFPSVSSPNKVGTVINGEIRFFTETGNFHDKEPDVIRDLFMAPVMREGWINIYKGGMIGRCLHKTKQEALAFSSSSRTTCIRIEWEE